MDDADSFRIQAELVVLSASQFYAPGEISLRGGRIVGVTSELTHAADVKLKGYALLPGLVNAHTHLEFSDLSEPLPRGNAFPDWIESVLAHRHLSSPRSVEHRIQTLAMGLEESRFAGVAAIADIVTPPWMPAHLNAAGMLRKEDAARYRQLPVSLSSQIPFDKWRQLQTSADNSSCLPVVVACLEQLGLSADRVVSARAWLEQVDKVPLADWPENLAALGLAPHALYSTLETGIHRAVQLAAEQKRLIAMHIAESPAERQWIDHGGGPFVDFHHRLGLSAVSSSPRAISDLCHELAAAPHAILIHGNYLSAPEMEAIAAHRANLSVVYCPRTHRHFQHAPYPLEALIALGVRVVLGTDSRSTNPDLNLWQEARTALLEHAALRPSDALAAITSGAAQAIGLESQFGSLLPGKMAAINALPIESGGNLENIEELLRRWFEEFTNPIPLTF